jgi:hypothetical protein
MDPNAGGGKTRSASNSHNVDPLFDSGPSPGGHPWAIAIVKGS